MDRPHPVAAGLLLRRRGDKVDRWLLLKASKHGDWGFPKGHQDPGESLWQTALRECVEETGIALVAGDGPARELVYTLPDGRRKRAVYFPAVTASETWELSHEHDDARWFDADAVLKHLRHANLRALFGAYLRGVVRR
jgi:8-oxo-dGTP pyrophosphatase MutT (NUDIX family)